MADRHAPRLMVSAGIWPSVQASPIVKSREKSSRTVPTRSLRLAERHFCCGSKALSGEPGLTRTSPAPCVWSHSGRQPDGRTKVTDSRGRNSITIQYVNITVDILGVWRGRLVISALVVMTRSCALGGWQRVTIRGCDWHQRPDHRRCILGDSANEAEASAENSHRR